jgi:hypothetical protein
MSSYNTNIPYVIKMQRKNGQVVKPYDIYIGRSCYMGGWKLETSEWHNPFKVKEYGIQKALELYYQYIINKPELMAKLPTLKGKILGCFCGDGPQALCHGNILVYLVSQLPIIVPVFNIIDDKKDKQED